MSQSPVFFALFVSRSVKRQTGKKRDHRFERQAWTLFSGVSSVLLWSVITTAAAWAQVGTGSISGTVSDRNGAAVVGASVTVTAVQTGVTIRLTSNADGLYVAPDLNVGRYQIEIEAPGFKLQRQTGIDVTVGRRLSLDFTLEVGETTELITVEGGASTVETTTAEQFAQIGQTQMRELPLNGRNFEQLILLAPGVQQVNSNVQNSFHCKQQAFIIQ